MKKNIEIKNFFSEKFLEKNSRENFLKKFEKIKKNISDNINNKNNFFNIFNDRFELNLKLKDLKRFKNYKTVVIVGMGGSILGAEAIYKFLREKVKKKFYFLNNIDVEKVSCLKKKLKFNKTLFMIISKSGDTIETLSNTLILKIINRNKKNIIIISEKNDNFLYSIAKSQNLFFIQHKSYIGGRFSVLSEVGLVPAFIMGLKILDFSKNQKKYLFKKENLFLKDSSIFLANIILKRKLTNLIFLNYSPNLEKFLFWLQQLIAESLGKQGKGFLPVISNVPKDHHSLLQLYLDGPKDKIFYIFSVKEKNGEKINIRKYSKKFSHLDKKSLSEIKFAQKRSLKKTLKKNKIPFREIKIEETSEKALGELFSYFMLETIMIGLLIGINPFNQNAVEKIKVGTKKELSN